MILIDVQALLDLTVFYENHYKYIYSTTADHFSFSLQKSCVVVIDKKC